MAHNQPHTWIRIGTDFTEILWNEGGLIEFRAGGQEICLVRRGTDVLACTARCPHAGAKMANGYVDARGQLVCPLHHYRFDPATGRNVSGEGYILRTYKVEQRPDGLYVCIPG